MRSALILLLSLSPGPLAAQSPFPADADVREIACRGVPIEGKGGMVIGLLSPGGEKRIVSAADVPYDGRTLFEIGSIAKVFTGILLADMVERGEVRLDDPVAELLPVGTQVPSRHGRQIRLVDLATHSVVLSNRNNGVDRIGQHLLDPRVAVSTAGVARGFHILPITLAAFLIVGVAASWRRTGATWLRTALVAVATALGMAAWMGLTYAAALFGVLRFDGRFPMMMLLVPLMLALSIGLAVSGFGRRLALGLPLWVLVGFQSFRLPLELLMHEAYEAGLMPVQMSYSGLNFDIVTGASAVVVAALVGLGRVGTRVVRAWNILGALLLCNIIVVSLLSTPTPLRVFRTQPPNTWVSTAPYIWLPAVMVALAVMGHIVVYRASRVHAAVAAPPLLEVR